MDHDDGCRVIVFFSDSFLAVPRHQLLVHGPLEMIISSVDKSTHSNLLKGSLSVLRETIADKDTPCERRRLFHIFLKSRLVDHLHIFITVQRKYPVVGGFCYGIILGGAKIVTPVEMINAVGVFPGQFQSSVVRAGIYYDDLKPVRQKTLATFFDM